MITRRAVLQGMIAASMAAATGPVLVLSRRAGAAPAIVDLNVSTGPASGAILIARGAQLDPGCLRAIGGDSFHALLAPASAVILAEYLRFERDVTVTDVSARRQALISPAGLRRDARWVTVEWPRAATPR